MGAKLGRTLLHNINAGISAYRLEDLDENTIPRP